MTRSTTTTTTTALLRSAWLAAGLALAMVAPAAAQPPEAQTTKRVVKKVREAPEGDERRVIAVRRVAGDGERGPGPMLRTRLLGGGYLGVELTELTPELREHFGAPADRGVMVARVGEDTPAERAGLAVGDVITEVDGEPIAGGWDLGVAIRAHDAGEEVDLGVWRDGSRRSLRATVEEREREQIHVEGFLRPEGGAADGSPQIYRFRSGGEDNELYFDTEGLEMLGEQLGRLDWPLLEGGLVQEHNRELESRLKELEKRLAELEEELRRSRKQ